MKKIFLFLPLCLMALAACNDSKNSSGAQQRELDSLKHVLSQRDEELEDIMNIVNDVQDGFHRINEAEGRIIVADGNAESASSRQLIRENIDYIQEAMQQNRELIAQLQEKLKKSNISTTALQKTIENLQAQLERQNQRVQELEAQLAEKEAVIARQDEQISNLNDNVSTLTQENEEKSKTVSKQDQQLHKAWFVFGTKSELKEQKILQSGDVLRKGDFNKDYFTEVDIRVMKEIKLYSKSAKLMTTHPEGSYRLEKDTKGEYTLKISNPTKFWSVSKYLVILVK